MLSHTVLIVDDQIINRRILKKILCKEYQTIEAENGKEALEILHQNYNNISAVLLDIVMPVMNGHELLKKMQEDTNLSKIPVIVSSTQDGDEAEIKALSLGAYDFVSKPYKPEIILQRLNNTIHFRETAALVNRAQKDELTGLYNKPFFIRKLSELLMENPRKQYDLVCFGVERFKLVNETYGLDKGDALLSYIADLLKKSKNALLAARFSADIFYVVVNHHKEINPDVYNKWIKKINEFPIDLDIKTNCGIYQSINGSESLEVICDYAQLAARKNKGIYNQPFNIYDESIRENLLKEQFIISHMESALHKKQFKVYYQPKYDLNNELIAGAEALVRWDNPEKGLIISPGEFIPLFEKNGFINELDRYVWEATCMDIRRWIDLGYPHVAISVNVSRADIYNPRLVDILCELVDKYRIPINSLHLEITESCYTDNPEQIIKVINKLRSLGFIIEMDDFGSGYSSLNMLAEIPVNILKLDMRFIQTEIKAKAGKGILSFVISLAKWLDLAVVAEGVETSEQIKLLRSMDCNYVQGFYYAKPMKCEDFERLIAVNPTTEMICNSPTISQYEEDLETKEAAKNDAKMLIVDDIELNRVILTSIFEDKYKVVGKENGKKAWDYLNKHYSEIAIVLLDLLMPVMDGFQLLKKIREDNRMKDLPVIITSQGDESSEKRALSIRADDFIAKPYNPAIIIRRVSNVLAAHRIQAMTKKPLNKDSKEKAFELVEILKPHFDVVRLVEPEGTLVRCNDQKNGCEIHACYNVWGKTSRCNNCTSIKALHNQSRYCKLEYSSSGLYFVVSDYVPFGEEGAVVEMVSHLDDTYVEGILNKKQLYRKLDALKVALDKDPLTNVYNRHFLDNHLPHIMLQQGERLSIAMIDIDDFKSINDRYGHVVGDRVLKAVGEVLWKSISLGRGDFVARYGGDEFIVVCRNIEMSVFVKRMKSVCEKINALKVEGCKRKCTISCGCTDSKELADFDSEKMIQKADQRLYLSKEKGKNCVIYQD